MSNKPLAILMTTKPFRHIMSHIELLFAIFISYSPRTSLVGVGILLLSYLFFYSAIYQINEVIDLERDLQDPVRALRPLASGIISSKEVITCAIVLLSISVAIVVIMKPILIFSYVILFIINLLYVSVLKKYPYIDIIVISSTHVLKFITGILMVSTVSDIWRFLYILGIIYFVVLAYQMNKQVLRLKNGRSSLMKNGHHLNIYIMNFLTISALGIAFIILFSVNSEVSIYLWIYTLCLTAYIFVTSFKRNPVERLIQLYDKQ